MTLIVAHRGASRREAENTLAAFRAAGELGADGVELDVRRTGDDRLVVHHNPSLADGRPLRVLAMSELPGSVPTLDQALDACAGMFVNIEIKNDETESDFDTSEWVAHRVCALLVDRAEPLQRWLISSFRIETVDTCRTVMPGVPTAWLTMDCSDESIGRAVAGGHSAIHPLVDTLDEQRVRAAHAVGLHVNTWTCDDPDRIAELVAWGVDGIVTNVPDVALGVRTGVRK